MRICNILLAAALLLVLTSCETFKKKAKTEDGEEITEPKWTFTVNEIVRYPRASMLEKEVPSFDGRTVWVQKHYPLSSRNVKSIELIPLPNKPGYYNLKLQVDQRGSRASTVLSNKLTGTSQGALIDNMFYRVVEIEKPTGKDEEFVVLKGPFDEIIAQKLKNFAVPNYKLFHYEEDDK